MDPKPKVILNCRSAESLLPALQKALQDQMHSIELKLLESRSYPSRLSQIDEEDRIYFFFDEDVELPSMHYLKKVDKLFKNNPDLLVLGGRYLPHVKQSYLSNSYNTQIELWLFRQLGLKNGLIPCQNLPGGVWIISGRVKKHLHDWKEPEIWAGEDTYSIRWLQKKGIQSFYHEAADVIHHPRSHFFHFCKRAFLQGKAREKLSLRSQYNAISWNLIWKHKLYWPGWALHQAFVEMGSFLFLIKSLIAKMTPDISPTEYKK